MCLRPDVCPAGATGPGYTVPVPPHPFRVIRITAGGGAAVQDGEGGAMTVSDRRRWRGLLREKGRFQATAYSHSTARRGPPLLGPGHTLPLCFNKRRSPSGESSPVGSIPDWEAEVLWVPGPPASRRGSERTGAPEKPLCLRSQGYLSHRQSKMRSWTLASAVPSRTNGVGQGY